MRRVKPAIERISQLRYDIMQFNSTIDRFEGLRKATPNSQQVEFITKLFDQTVKDWPNHHSKMQIEVEDNLDVDGTSNRTPGIYGGVSSYDVHESIGWMRSATATVSSLARELQSLFAIEVHNKCRTGEATRTVPSMHWNAGNATSVLAHFLLEAMSSLSGVSDPPEIGVVEGRGALCGSCAYAAYFVCSPVGEFPAIDLIQRYQDFVLKQGFKYRDEADPRGPFSSRVGRQEISITFWDGFKVDEGGTEIRLIMDRIRDDLPRVTFSLHVPVRPSGKMGEDQRYNFLGGRRNNADTISFQDFLPFFSKSGPVVAERVIPKEDDPTLLSSGGGYRSKIFIKDGEPPKVKDELESEIDMLQKIIQISTPNPGGYPVGKMFSMGLVRPRNSGKSNLGLAAAVAAGKLSFDFESVRPKGDPVFYLDSYQPMTIHGLGADYDGDVAYIRDQPPKEYSRKKGKLPHHLSHEGRRQSRMQRGSPSKLIERLTAKISPKAERQVCWPDGTPFVSTPNSTI
jgi:hypothetical protein